MLHEKHLVHGGGPLRQPCPALEDTCMEEPFPVPTGSHPLSFFSGPICYTLPGPAYLHAHTHLLLGSHAQLPPFCFLRLQGWCVGVSCPQLWGH